MKLHIGCGRDIRAGWVNLNLVDLPGIDELFDLESCGTCKLPFNDDTFEEVEASHVLEHITNILPLMAELHRVSAAGAKATFRTPYGSSDDAFEDPTHVRQFFRGSWGYFSQPFYWRADYGYRGDWQPKSIVLRIRQPLVIGLTSDEIMNKVDLHRNVVFEMEAELDCIKPVRPQQRDLQVGPRIALAIC